MLLKHFIAGIFILSAMLLQAKSLPNKAFESYVRKQDSLMVEAYKQRDTLTYTKLLDDFVIRYEQLSKRARQISKTIISMLIIICAALIHC